MAKHKVLIADSFGQSGVDILNEASEIEVIYDGGTSREDLLKIIPDIEGLIIRSATTVDAEVLDKAEKLKVVIRAGVGVDNIDIPHASKRGVIVENAPGGNSISTAEQAIALMFAAARNIAPANESMHAGKWEKKKFKGTQLTGKTLAVLGLGRIGKEVVKRGKGLQMNVIGYDPYIPAENLSHLEIDIKELDEILPEADFISVHTPLTDSTRDLINKESITKLKKTAILINCARGGIYNEPALAEALAAGTIKAAALDVFTKEPLPEDSPLKGTPNLTMTPHLGASTSEAETLVAEETAESMVQFFRSGVARNSLNFPTLDPSDMSFLEPYFTLGEYMGAFGTQLLGEAVESIHISYRGTITDYDLRPVQTAILKGVLYQAFGDEVNIVNTPFLAKERGLVPVEEKTDKARNYQNLLSVRLGGSKGHITIEGITIGGEPRIVQIESYHGEIRLSEHMLVVKNRDKVGVLGHIASYLAQSGINIANLYLARGGEGSAMTIICVDSPVSKEQLAELTANTDLIIEGKVIHLPHLS